MIIDTPTTEDREPVRYVAVATAVPMDALETAIPAGIDRVEHHLTQAGIEPSGPPLVRYRVIDMDAVLQIEIGVCVAAPVDVTGTDLVCDTLPAGKYARLIYRDVSQGIEGNGALLDWIKDNGFAADAWSETDGDAFASRVEFFLTGPDEDPDPAQWDTEVAIRLAD